MIQAGRQRDLRYLKGVIGGVYDARANYECENQDSPNGVAVHLSFSVLDRDLLPDNRLGDDDGVGIHADSASGNPIIFGSCWNGYARFQTDRRTHCPG